MDVTAQQVDSCIAAWMDCVAVNIMWMVLHSKWTVLLQLELIVLQWTLCDVTAQQVESCILFWMEFATVYIMWKLRHSSWAVSLWLEWSVLKWTLCWKYCTAVVKWYCSLNGVSYSEFYVEGTAQQVDSVIAALNGVCYSKHYMEDTSQQVDSGIAGWRSILKLTLCERYCTTG